MRFGKDKMAKYKRVKLEAELEVNNPTVEVLRTQEICDYFQNYRSKSTIDIKLKKLEVLLKPLSSFS